MNKKIIYVAAVSFVVLLFSVVLMYSHFFGPVDSYAGQVEFIVHPNESRDEVANTLKKEGFIRSRFIFDLAFAGASKGLNTVRPGGYQLSASMDMWSIASALTRPPYFVFFSFPPGWRKEQIADKLATTFNWTDAQKQEWITIDTAPSASFQEGVYFPDTYLLPSDQSPKKIAERFRERFQEEFAPYAAEAQKQGLQWTDVVILASLLEREAAGAQDMPLIAGIMLNRLNDNMSLQIDATLQYIRGKEGSWWPVPTPADKALVSPFNTYKHVGLPPHAISEPGIGAIKAVLNAEDTKCLYYLHDPHGQIHCSPTYAGQLANVQKYLK